MRIDVLVVEDDDRKASQLRALVGDLFGVDDASVARADCAAEARDLLLRQSFDVLIVDLNLPLRAGEEPRSDGGVELVSQLSRRRMLKLPTHVIGLSAYDDLIIRHGPEFREELWHLVKYDEATNEWRRMIGRKLLYVAEAKSGIVASDAGVDLAIMTALHKVELEAVLALSPRWLLNQPEDDDTLYHTTSWRREGGDLSVVAAACPEMGMTASAVLAMKMIQRFRPAVIAMCGIAAGVKGAYGDVLVAEHCWDYGSGKLGEAPRSRVGGSIFLPAPAQIRLDPLLKAKLSFFMIDRSVMREIHSRYVGDKPCVEPACVMGPVASGAAVVQNPEVIEQILLHNRKLVGIEMEAYGLFMAALNCSRPRPMAFMAKSICDFGDKHKNDQYQSYAAYTSAAFVYEFALQHLARRSKTPSKSKPAGSASGTRRLKGGKRRSRLA